MRGSRVGGPKISDGGFSLQRSTVWFWVFFGLAASCLGPRLPAQDLLLDGGGEDALSELLEEEGDLFQQEQTVSTALGYAQRIERTPSNVFVITREQIQAANPKHPAEMLRFIPGFTVFRRQQFSYEISALGSGGIFSNKVLALIDGHRAVGPQYGNIFWHTLPLIQDDVERIEVVVGPESTIYGSNAFAAVVNFITRSPKKEESRFVARSGSDSYNQFNWMASSQRKNSSTRFVVSSEHRGSVGGLYDFATTGLISPTFSSGDSFTNQMARISHHQKVGDKTELKLSFGAVDSDIGGIQAGFFGQPQETNGRQDQLSIYLDLEHALSPTRSVSFKASYDRSHRAADIAPFATLGNPETSISGTQKQFDLRYHFEPAEWKLNLGVGTTHTASKGLYIDPTAPTLTHDFAYANGEREFGEHFVLFLGARFVDQDIAKNSTSWKAAGLYRPRRDLAFRLGTGTSFRSPDIFTYFFRPLTQLQTAFGPRSLNVPLQAPNPNLQNEETQGFWQFGVEKLWKQRRVKLDFYRARILNLIGFTQTSTPVFATLPSPPLPPGSIVPLGTQGIYTNSPQRGLIRGVTLAYQQDLPRNFKLHLGLNFQDLDLERTSVPDGYAPNRSGSLMLYRPAKGKRIGGSLSWTGVGAYNVSTRRTSGYGMVGVNLERNLGPDRSVSLTVENLLDRQHYEVSDLVIARHQDIAMLWGRTAYLTLSTKL
jgi:iron complex outermembrane receptor protein